VIRLAVVLAVAGALALLGWGVLRPSDDPASPLTGRPASDFTFEAFDGRTVTLSELRGRPVVLNFYASWCLACRDEAAVLEEGWRTYGPRGAVFIGLAVRDEREDAIAFARRYGKTYLLGPDAHGRVGLDYGLFGVPETVFISPDGLVAGKVVGPVTREILARRLEAWL
jgi:cytochrome c biogenesis protein CcmG/thiol:disulfide interchange protein DsbE